MENSSNLSRFSSCAPIVHTSAVRLASSMSEEFTIEMGVKQGGVIAPDLSNCVIDHLMHRMLRRCRLGIQLTDLDYADDIAIFAPSACVLQEAVIILQEEASLMGMQISWPKTKLMAITPNTTNLVGRIGEKMFTSGRKRNMVQMQETLTYF